VTNLSKLATDLDQGLLTTRQKKISADSIVKVLDNLENPNCSVSWCSANWINNGKGLTHVLLAVRIKDHIFIGHAEGSVQRSSPGRAWADLKPWNPNLKTIKEKIRSWTKVQKIVFHKKELNKFKKIIQNLYIAQLTNNEKNKNIVVKEQIVL